MDIKRLNSIMGVNNNEDDFYELEDSLIEDENDVDFELYEQTIRDVENESDTEVIIKDDFFELDEIPESDW